jgi:hypothetical protein
MSRAHWSRIRAYVCAGAAGVLLAGSVADVSEAASEPSSPLCHIGTWETAWRANPWAKEIPQETVRIGPRLYHTYQRQWLSSNTGMTTGETRVHVCEGLPQQKADPEASWSFLDSGRWVFSGATLYRRSTAGGWRETIGAINDKWRALGYENSIIGAPVTNETPTPTKVGAFNHFSNGGSIYWSPSTGAHEVHGQIRDKWAALGWERGDMGFPLTDETRTPNKAGAFNHFQSGWSIYWSPSTGAHEVHGQIRDRWAALGWENSPLGFPTSDEFATSDGGRRSNFQNNCFIQWYPGQGATAYCNNVPRF